MEFPVSIRRFLPHREPMLMVDDVLRLDDQCIATSFEIKEDNIFVENGFLNESGLIENAAQTCSGIVGKPYFDANKEGEEYKVLGYISRIKKTEIFKFPKVNSVLTTEGKLLSMHPIGEVYNCEMKCLTYSEGKLMAESSFSLIIQG